MRGGAKRAAAKAAERYRSDVRAIYDASKALEAEVPSTSATAQDSYLYILSVALSGLRSVSGLRGIARGLVHPLSVCHSCAMSRCHAAAPGE